MRLRCVFQTIMAAIFLAGAGSCGSSPVLASQEASPANTTGKSASAGPTICVGRSPVSLSQGDCADLPDRHEPDRGRPAARSRKPPPVSISRRSRADSATAAGWLSSLSSFSDRPTCPTFVIPDDGDRSRLRDRREQGHQAHAPSDGGRPLAVRRQDSAATCRRCGCSSGNKPWRRARARKPAMCRRISGRRTRCFHTFIAAFKKNDLDAAARCLDLTEIPDPARPYRGAAARVQAQGSARPDHLHHLPGPSGFLGRPSPGGPGAQGGPDHRGAAGRGSTQGAMALQPGHGSLGGPAL